MTTLKEEFTQINDEFIYHHGMDGTDLQKYVKIQEEFKNTRQNKPTAGDILEIWSNNGYCFYKNAHIENASFYDSKLTYCEQPYIPFYFGGESFSTSGGSWGELDVTKCEYIGTREKLVKTWGHCGACGHGAFNVKVVANVYKIVINRKYIPLYCGTYKNNDMGYKYWIDRYDKKMGFRCHKICFKTLKGFKDYLKNTNLKIGKRFGWGNHEILGDFDFEQLMSYGEYKAIKGDLKEFPLLDNGEYTGAFLKNGKIYFCNCNVKDRKRYPYQIV